MTKDLALAVLRCAFEDLQRLHSNLQYVTIGRHKITDAVETAIQFLTSTDPEPTEWRQFWCERAGLDAERVRLGALVILQESKNQSKEPK